MPVETDNDREKMELCNEPSLKKIKTEQVGAYPVDFLKNYQDLKNTEYQKRLEERGDNPHQNSVYCWVCHVHKANIQTSNIQDFNIFDDDIPAYRIQGLLCDSEEPHFAGLRVTGRWWSVDELLSSENTLRNGLMEVKQFGERMVLSVLNTIVYNQHEKTALEPTFAPHPLNEAGKIMWQYGKAVGFYTLKKKGKLVSPFSPEVWEMNVLDTIFVKKGFRSKGLAKQMVEDFMNDCPNQDIGFSYPLTKALKAICLNILNRRDGCRDRVWECKEPGGRGMHGRMNLWRSLNAEKISGMPTTDAPVIQEN